MKPNYHLLVKSVNLLPKAIRQVISALAMLLVSVSTAVDVADVDGLTM